MEDFFYFLHSCHSPLILKNSFLEDRELILLGVTSHFSQSSNLMSVEKVLVKRILKKKKQFAVV